MASDKTGTHSRARTGDEEVEMSTADRAARVGENVQEAEEQHHRRERRRAVIGARGEQANRA
jgi:hypothetical protein